jgi:hypothetical protein
MITDDPGNEFPSLARASAVLDDPKKTAVGRSENGAPKKTKD